MSLPPTSRDSGFVQSLVSQNFQTLVLFMTARRVAATLQVFWKEARNLAASPIGTQDGTLFRKSLPNYLLKYRHNSRQNVVQKVGRQGFQLASIAGIKIEHPRLIAANDTRCFESRKLHGKADPPREIAAVRDGQDHGQLRRSVESISRDHQDRTVPPLLPTRCGIEIDHVDIATLHISSRPTAGASIHSRSSAGCGVV